MKCGEGTTTASSGLVTQPDGDGPNEMGDFLAAVDLGASRTATEIATGQHHSCALLDDGSVKCWGLNSAGQPG